nr:MAG TPA: hypothetical protein [Bacteriophage sp.]
MKNIIKLNHYIFQLYEHIIKNILILLLDIIKTFHHLIH